MVQCDVPDKLAMFSYLTQIYEVFRGEIPYIKHPKLVSSIRTMQNEIGRFLTVLRPLPPYFIVFSVSYPISQVEHLPPEHSLTSRIHPHSPTSDPTSQWNRSPSFIVYDQSAESLSHPNSVTFSQRTAIGSLDHNNNQISLSANVAEVDDRFAISWIRNKLEKNIVASSLKKIFKPPSSRFDIDHERCRLDNSKVNQKLP